MPESGNSPVNVHVNVISNSPDAVAQAAGRDAQIHQVEQAPLQDQVAALLEHLLTQTKAGVGDHSALREATRELQTELEETSALSQDGKTRFQRAAEALPAADKAVGIATKLVGLICKLPGIGIGL